MSRPAERRRRGLRLAFTVGVRLVCVLLAGLLIVSSVQVERGPRLTLTHDQAMALDAGQSVGADLDGKSAVVRPASRPRLDVVEGEEYCVEAKNDGRYILVQCTSWLWDLPLVVLVLLVPDLPRLIGRWARAHPPRADRRRWPRTRRPTPPLR